MIELVIDPRDPELVPLGVTADRVRSYTATIRPSRTVRLAAGGFLSAVIPAPKSATTDEPVTFTVPATDGAEILAADRSTFTYTVDLELSGNAGRGRGGSQRVSFTGMLPTSLGATVQVTALSAAEPLPATFVSVAELRADIEGEVVTQISTPGTPAHDAVIATVGTVSDPATASLVSGATATRAALDARYPKKGDLIVNALDHGVKADGVTNDAPAWNALVTSLDGTGATITWAGKSMLDAPIFWKRGVSLIGQGWGRSILATRGGPAVAAFSAIDGNAPYSSTSNPYVNLLFKDFEVDGSGLQITGPNIAGKAIYMQFLRRCQFVNLYLHDTIGTALGTDYMPDCLIHGVVVVNGGRGWDGAEAGHAGIGIGMGAWPEENITISDCHTINCGHWGIFVEKQGEAAYRSRGAKITGCSVTGTRGTGIGDYGCTDTLIANCSATGNGTSNVTGWRDGITAEGNAVGTRILNNTVSDNIGDGVAIRFDATEGITVADNKIVRNGRRGVNYAADTQTSRNLTIRDNYVAEHQFDGINLVTASAGSLLNPVVTGNRCVNNGLGGVTNGDRGIVLNSNVDGGVIAGNRCYDTQATKTQSFGIALAAGTFSNTVLSGNNVVGNKTGGVSIAGTATLTSVTRRGNAGFATEAGGSNAIPDGAATVVVPHGLGSASPVGTAPTNVTITPTSSGDMWLSAVTATTFTVSRTGTAGAAGFRWSAVVW